MAHDASAEIADVRLGTALDGRFRLDERLGAGGMGVVYRGVDTESGKPIAVKFLHEALAGVTDLVKRFDREVKAMRRLSHPRLVAILDSGLAAGVPYLVMEFLKGRSLSELLERGAFKGMRAVWVAQQILEGVACAHKAGVVHRDLKPDNILLADEDAVKILDFGLAKLAQDGATQLTNTGLALGTPGYMSPEQAHGSPTDQRTDIYSVGVILYHMIVGKKPFVAESPLTVMRMHMEEPPVPPRKAAPDARISVALETVILKALEKEPSKRWSSAEAFSQALASTLEGGASTAPEAPLPDEKTSFGKRRVVAPPAQRRRSRGGGRALRWVVGLCVLAALAGGGLFAWRHVSRRTQTKVTQTFDGAMDKAKQAMKSLEKAAPEKAAPEKAAPEKAAPPEKPVPDKPAARADDDDDDALPPRDTPGARLEESSKPTAKVAQLADATKLLAAGKVDDAIQALYQLRKRTPRSAAVPLNLGHAYFRKTWRHDALREYALAISLSPAVKTNGTLIHNAVQALDDPTYKYARGLIKKHIGSAALAELRRVARVDKDATLRKRAAKLAGELPRPRRRR